MFDVAEVENHHSFLLLLLFLAKEKPFFLSLILFMNNCRLGKLNRIVFLGGRGESLAELVVNILGNQNWQSSKFYSIFSA